MYNKNSFVSDPKFLQKPRKRIIPQGPDMANFVTGSTDLKKYANFGLEMMKFLPKFEQLTYAGKRLGEGADAVEINVGGGKTASLSQEYYDAFNEYNLNGYSDAEIHALFAGMDGNANDNEDDPAYTPHNNTEAISEFLALTPNGAPFNNRYGFVFGQHHRAGGFGVDGWGDDELGGEGAGKQFKNINFVTGASEWNHIRRPKSGSVDATANAEANQLQYVQGYFNTINESLAADGQTQLSWTAMQNVLNSFTNPDGSKMSFYQIVMDPAKKYQTLSAKNAFLLIASMLESRSRSWGLMTDAFGPVNQTRNDSEMIDVIDNNAVADSASPYLDHHALSLFPFFLRIQHSVLNQMTMFYERAETGTDGLTGSRLQAGQGYNLSVLDKTRFMEFVTWMGRSLYDVSDASADSNLDKSYSSIDVIDTISDVADLDGYELGLNASFTGKLYEFRGAWTAANQMSLDSLNEIEDPTPTQQASINSLTKKKAKVTAVNNLIKEWFGATDSNSVTRSDGTTMYVPRWAEYGEDQAPVEVSGAASVGPVTYDGTTFTPATISWTGTNSFSWDRKWNSGNLTVTDTAGAPHTVGMGTENGDSPFGVWGRLVTPLGSNINPNIQTGHKNYTAVQATGLTFNGIVGGPLYQNNWVVHAIGYWYKQGISRDIVSVAERAMNRRVSAAQYKQDMRDFVNKKDDLANDKADQEKAEMKAAAKFKAMLNRMTRKNARHDNAPKNDKPKDKPPVRNGAIQGSNDSRDMAKALQKFASSQLMANASKHKAWLQKMKNGS